MTGWSVVWEPGQMQLMWSWCDGLQSKADDCRLRCRQCGPEVGDRGKECGPENALIAVLTHFDCRPLVRHEVA